MHADYPVLPAGSGTVDEKEASRAELVLARLADTQLMMARRPVMQIARAVMVAGQLASGALLRGQYALGWQEAAVTGAGLAVAALAVPAMARKPRKAVPPWASAAEAHEESLAGRLPEATRAVAQQAMSTTRAARLQGAHLYVPRCAEVEPAHFSVCHEGATMVMSGRLLVILGEHLAGGPAARAAAVLGHERGHATGLRPYLSALAAMGGTWGLLVAAWALPWPTAIMAAIGLRVTATALAWLVEASCDLGGARDAGPAAMVEALEWRARAVARARALQPRRTRLAVSVLTWMVLPGHPPLALRRAAIRALA
jgi:hypothetical protein